MGAAPAALEEVGPRLIILVERPQVVLQLAGRPAVHGALVSQHFHRIGVCLQLLAPSRTEEGRTIAAVKQPVLLLGAVEPGVLVVTCSTKA